MLAAQPGGTARGSSSLCFPNLTPTSTTLPAQQRRRREQTYRARGCQQAGELRPAGKNPSQGSELSAARFVGTEQASAAPACTYPTPSRFSKTLLQHSPRRAPTTHSATPGCESSMGTHPEVGSSGAVGRGEGKLGQRGETGTGRETLLR